MSGASDKIFYGLTNPKMLPPPLHTYTINYAISANTREPESNTVRQLIEQELQSVASAVCLMC